MSAIFEYNPSIDFDKHIFWQYNNAPNFNALINSKQNWYNTNQVNFWLDWVQNVINIATANDYGLTIWGILLKVQRTYDVNGTLTTLTIEQFRTVLIAQLKLLHIKGTVPEINQLLKFLFGKYGKAYVVDNFNMTMTYYFNFNLTPLQIAVLQNITLLPRPAGVKMNVLTVTKNVFGFNGSGCQPFNQAPFAVYGNIL